MNKAQKSLVTLHLKSELRAINMRSGHMSYVDYDDVCFVTNKKFDGDEIPAEEIHQINLDIAALLERRGPPGSRELILLRRAYVTLDDAQESYTDKKCFCNLSFAITGNCPLNPDQVPKEVLELVKAKVTARMGESTIEFEGTWDVNYDGPVMEISSLKTECLGGDEPMKPPHRTQP